MTDRVAGHITNAAVPAPMGGRGAWPLE